MFSWLKSVNLTRLLFLTVGGVLLVVIVAFFSLAWIEAGSLIEPAVQREIAERSVSATTVIESSIESAVAQAELLALSPSVNAAALRGAEIARQRGLEGLAVDVLERRLAGNRSLQVDANVDLYLQTVVERSLFAEVFVTDRNGFVVAGSSQTSDFVQHD
ncbi:MAG TPA: hypothetical protein VLC48_05865, partial [Gemmatimonadota bacterium]|nr:hypothetical protein [Gemmatimonadota bacterium]